MQLPAVWGKIGGVSLALLLSACAQKNIDDEVEPVADDAAGLPFSADEKAKSDNPCLQSWVLDGIRDNFKSRAFELLSNKRGAQPEFVSLIDNIAIEFDYISAPNYQVDDSVDCTAQTTISYYGDNETDPKIVTKTANSIENHRYNGSYLGLGLNPYNVTEMSVQDNTISTQIRYKIASSFTENGDQQQSYRYWDNGLTKMLATVAGADVFQRQLFERNATKKQEAMAAQEQRDIETKKHIAEVDQHFRDMVADNEARRQADDTNNNYDDYEVDSASADAADQVTVDAPEYE